MVKNEKLRYLISGIIGFGVDLLILLFLIEVIFNDSQGPKIISLIYSSKLISSIIGQSVSFTINRYWTFNSITEHVYRQVVKMIMIFMLNIFIASILYSLYFDVLDLLLKGEQGGNSLTATISNFATSATQMILNFFFYKYFVFRQKYI
ncbi:GtrA family protein [Candidatus Dojkabacteria bacterium]|uniref:GtrA family protein n=1 Tax=Candidatus Dojkabacteria bacterium TaxID=2099670 RepID=A0A955RL13_9BACT|nr:GtrA family protein [Candidatus Dojkabacteria bacterium]